MNDKSPNQEIFLLLRCPSCARRHEVSPRLLGREINCQGCGRAFLLQSEPSARKSRAKKQRTRVRKGKFIRDLKTLEAGKNRPSKMVVTSLPRDAAGRSPNSSNDEAETQPIESKIATIPKEDPGSLKWQRRAMLLVAMLVAGGFLAFGIWQVSKDYFRSDRRNLATNPAQPRNQDSQRLAMHTIGSEAMAPNESSRASISFLGFKPAEVAFEPYMVLTTSTKQAKQNLLLYSPDGASIALDGPDCVQVFSAATGFELERYPNKGDLDNRITQFAFSDDSKNVYQFGPRSSGPAGTGLQSNYELVSYRRNFRGDPEETKSTRISLWDHRNHPITVVGNRVFCSNGMVDFSGQPEHVPFEGFFCEDIAPDGTLITYNRKFSSDSFHGAVSAWNVAVAPTNRFTSVVFPTKHYGGNRTELTLAFSADSKKALMGLEMDSAFSELDLKTGDILARELRLLSGEHIHKFLIRLHSPTAMAIHPSGRVAAIERNFGDDRHWVALVDVQEAILIGGLSFARPIVNLAFSPEGETLSILTRSISGADVSLSCAVVTLVESPKSDLLTDEESDQVSGQTDPRISHLEELESLFSKGERFEIDDQ